MKRKTIIYIIVAVLILGASAGGMYVYLQNISKTNNTSKTVTPKTKNTSKIITPANMAIKANVTKQANPQKITYKGIDGTNALKLLKEIAEVTQTGNGVAAHVTSINGLAADDIKTAWVFTVNGQAPSVGPGGYITKSSDTITWEYKSN